MKKPLIITGCGRSGTHWLGHVLGAVLGPYAAAWEPSDYGEITDVVVDSKLRHYVQILNHDGHRIVHLVRDGRDVVRSLVQWYSTNGCVRRSCLGDDQWLVTDVDKVSFEECCLEWSASVDVMDSYETLRLEDLSTPEARDSSPEYSIPHWTEWTTDQTDLFWKTCGKQMEKMGYGR